MTKTQNLAAAAESFSFLWDHSDEYRQVVSYGFAHRHAVAQSHDWLPEFEVFTADGEKVGSRKTATGAIKLLIKAGMVAEKASFAR